MDTGKGLVTLQQENVMVKVFFLNFFLTNAEVFQFFFEMELAHSGLGKHKFVIA